jgi:hypothetical protein
MATSAIVSVGDTGKQADSGRATMPADAIASSKPRWRIVRGVGGWLQ